MDLSWRKAQMEDATLLWRWANDPGTRQNSFSKAPIPYLYHVAWLESQLQSTAATIWIFSDGSGPAGLVRCEVAGQEAEIHITVAPDRRGRAYGKAMLTRALRLLREERGDYVRVKALVLDHNLPSLRLFKACGFQEVSAGERANGERVVLLELMDDRGEARRIWR